MKTKGALAWDFNQPWSVEEIEIGDPRRGEVKVHLEAAGLCHSDHHPVTGDIPMPPFRFWEAMKVPASSSKSATALMISGLATTSSSDSSNSHTHGGTGKPDTVACGTC